MFDVVTILKTTLKRFNNRDLLSIVGIGLIFFLTRLANLTKFPVFTDEGIYIHWARIAWHDASWRFISLTDGKQPLQTWGTIPFLKLFPDDSLLAGRLFSVSTGFVAAVGMFALLYYLFNKRTAIIGTLLYVLTPYFLFYDRLALADSAVNGVFIWIFLFSAWLVRSQRLDVSLLFGLVAGIGLLAKSSVQLFVGLSLFAPVLLIEKNIKTFLQKSINYGFLFVLSTGMAIVIYNVQRLSPFLHYVSQKNTTFILTFAELKAHPFDLLLHNLYTLPYYVASEMGYVAAVAGVIGLILLFKKNWRLASYITLWIVIPYILLSLVSKVVFPRYLIFFASMLTVLTAYLLASLKKTHLLLVSAAILISFAYINIPLLFNPSATPLPPVDRGQYIVGVTAGWHVDDIMQFAREKGQDKHVILMAEGNFGLIADMLDVHLRPSDNVSIKGYWPLEEKSLTENQPLVGENDVYVVFPHRTEFPPQWPIELVKKYEKPEGQSAFYLYKLKEVENYTQ